MSSDIHFILTSTIVFASNFKPVTYCFTDRNECIFLTLIIYYCRRAVNFIVILQFDVFIGCGYFYLLEWLFLFIGCGYFCLLVVVFLFIGCGYFCLLVVVILFIGCGYFCLLVVVTFVYWVWLFLFIVVVFFVYWV